MSDYGEEGFQAFVVRRAANEITSALEFWTPDQLTKGDVTIRVLYSSVNFKDALTLDPGNRVARLDPLIPGVDLAGVVIASLDPAVVVGCNVLVHGHELGTAHHGGFAQLSRVPGSWVLPIPDGLDPFTAMSIGTAGFTAAMALDRVMREGTDARAGPVLVTGASGGVGSFAVALFAAHGFHVVASTGSIAAEPYLRHLGAREVVDRDFAAAASSHKMLGEARWAAVVDNVGGSTLAGALRTTVPYGVIAAIGHTGGSKLETTIYPWITRGVIVAGMDAVHLPLQRRRELWQRIASGDLRPPLERIRVETVPIGELATALGRVRQGEIEGRVVVRLGTSRSDAHASVGAQTVSRRRVDAAALDRLGGRNGD